MGKSQCENMDLLFLHFLHLGKNSVVDAIESYPLSLKLQRVIQFLIWYINLGLFKFDERLHLIQRITA
jgi:hypothetical protein